MPPRRRGVQGGGEFWDGLSGWSCRHETQSACRRRPRACRRTAARPPPRSPHDPRPSARSERPATCCKPTSELPGCRRGPPETSPHRMSVPRGATRRVPRIRNCCRCPIASREVVRTPVPDGTYTSLRMSAPPTASRTRDRPPPPSLAGAAPYTLRRYFSHPLGTFSTACRCTIAPRLGTILGTARAVPVQANIKCGRR